MSVGTTTSINRRVKVSRSSVGSCALARGIRRVLWCSATLQSGPVQDAGSSSRFNRLPRRTAAADFLGNLAITVLLVPSLEMPADARSRGLRWKTLGPSAIALRYLIKMVTDLTGKSVIIFFFFLKKFLHEFKTAMEERPSAEFLMHDYRSFGRGEGEPSETLHLVFHHTTDTTSNTQLIILHFKNTKQHDTTRHNTAQDSTSHHVTIATTHPTPRTTSTLLVFQRHTLTCVNQISFPAQTQTHCIPSGESSEQQ